MRAQTSTLLLGCLFAAMAPHRSAAVERGATAAQVDALFADYARPGSPGCSLAVIRDGAIVHEKGYGLASIEHDVPIDPRRTVFDIGSTSKQFTAASVLLLAHEGKLSLDDDIHKTLPELPDYGAPVTIDQLLRHTAGVRDYVTLMALSGIHFEDYATDDDAMAAIVRQKTLDFAPGSEHSYSNSGYFLLSQVVKRVSGKSLRDFAQERIFTPLGMTHTQFLDDHLAIVAHRATGYAPHPDGGLAVEMFNWEQTGDGAVQSTVEDLAKWDRNFYRPVVGGPWLVEQLQTPGTLNDGSAIRYARGLFVDDYGGRTRVSHGGAWAGYRAELVRFPQQKLSAIVLCNLESIDASELALKVSDLYLRDRHAPAHTAAAAAPNATAVAVDLARYVGAYWSPTQGTVRRIKIKDGKLMYRRGGDNDSELAALGDDRFQMLGVPFTSVVTFDADAAGGARRMRVVAMGGAPTLFEAVQPVAPDAADLRAYSGTYASAELDTTWTLSVDDGRLTIHPKRGALLPLEPAFRDAFEGPGGIYRFQRDAAGVVNRLVFNAGRARDLGFNKESATAH